MEICLTTILFSFLFIAITLCTLLLIAQFFITTPYPNLSRYDSEKSFEDPLKGEKIPFPSIHDPPSMDLSVIVPAYNEEERLPTMMEEALEYLENRQKENPSFNYEIIIVDDGSKDKTTQTGLKYSSKYGTGKIRVLTLAKNRGKGGAVRLGMFVARGKQLLFADADGASQFNHLDKLEAEMSKINKNSDNMAVVCGSRAHLEKESVAQRSLFRTFLMYGFHFLVYILCVKGIKDTQCGFKLLTRDAVILLFSNLHVERCWLCKLRYMLPMYQVLEKIEGLSLLTSGNNNSAKRAFDVDLLYLAQYFKIPVGEVAINWQEIEGSKMVPVWSWLQMGRDLLLIRLRYILGAWKIDRNPKKSE